VTTIIAIAAFFLGGQMALRTVAAFYRIIDLWYTIGTACPQVLRGILGWGGGTVAIAALLPQSPRAAFVLGLLSFVGFYLTLYLIRPALVRRREALPSRPTPAVEPSP
jgi:hypothetical protein